MIVLHFRHKVCMYSQGISLSRFYRFGSSILSIEYIWLDLNEIYVLKVKHNDWTQIYKITMKHIIRVKVYEWVSVTKGGTMNILTLIQEYQMFSF